MHRQPHKEAPGFKPSRTACSLTIPVAVIIQPDKSNLREDSSYFIQLTIPGYSPSLREVEIGAEGANHIISVVKSRKKKKKKTNPCCLFACFTSSFLESYKVQDPAHKIVWPYLDWIFTTINNQDNPQHNCPQADLI